jgi:uncharacterized membrane protein YjgN (DUF898 family)
MSDTIMATDAAPMAEPRTLPITFHGTGKEYFGIWIVNVLLTIVTLGIYSAWAKVRNKRYFNGNTELDGHRFDYHAEPVKILIGRILVVLFLVGIQVLQYLDPLFGIAALVLYVVILPWVIVRGLRFNANMTSYRNVRFHFRGRKRDALVAYIVWPIAAMLSFFTLVPFASRANARFLGNGHAYGIAHFSADPPLKPYYKALGIAVLVGFVGIGLIVGGAVAGVFEFSSDEGFLRDPEALLTPEHLQFLVMTYGLILISYIIIIIANFIYLARSRNIGFNNLHLEGGHEFRSTVTAGRLTWITLSNVILILLTLTLFTPWAKVRLARYLADNTQMIAVSELDNFVEGQIDETGVTSGEFLSIEGFDFGF